MDNVFYAVTCRVMKSVFYMASRQATRGETGWRAQAPSSLQHAVGDAVWRMRHAGAVELAHTPCSLLQNLYVLLYNMIKMMCFFL